MPTTYQLGHEPIKDHVFFPDHKTLAVTKDNTVELYHVASPTATPQLVDVLRGHDKTVTSVDLSPDGKRILTCSQDRNALVWEKKQGEYKPTLVLLRISRAATVCKWSPSGNKFAVGSSDRVVAVCYYEEENDWWVSKHLKKPLKSTITTIAWHPNDVLLACGSTDGHVRVFSGYIKGLDGKPEASVWGSKLPFQTLCGDYTNETGAWIHGVAFSPSGDCLAYVGHDATLGVVYPAGEGLPPLAILAVHSNNLPFKAVLFAGENKIVAGGHSCTLSVFEGNEQGWRELKSLESKANVVMPVAVADDDDEMSSHDALKMFKQLDLKGRVTKPSAGSASKLATIHQNTIASIRAYSSNQVSTSGIDGKVVLFDL